MHNTTIRFSMTRFVTSLACLMALLFGSRSVHAFALLGPLNEPYQIINLDYGFGSDIGGPKNLGEEYRWNTPFLYYAFDQNFLDYFGEKGVEAVEQAISILNNLTNVSSYSAELSEFPLDTERVNFKAQSLGLVDIKSHVLNLLVEAMGLAEPDRYTWTLRNRALPPGLQCPAYAYTVIKRNFDPVTWEPSTYVNDTLYSYSILELCPTPDRADAVEIPVDPLSTPFSAVASPGSFSSFGPAETDLGLIRYGFFYTGLTRDDVGGFRYLLRTNNVNFESVPPSSEQFVTNTNPQIITGSNLTLLAAQALTNNAAQLQALYPGLIVTSSSNFFSVGSITNFSLVQTSTPWMPAGAFTVIVVPNVTHFAQTFFSHTFGNLVTVQSVNGQLVTVPIVTLTPFFQHHLILNQTAIVALTNAPFSPPTAAIITSNLTTKPSVTNTPVGEFFILPPNACDLAIITTLLTNVVAETNFLLSFTNNGTIVTNVNGGTNFATSQILSLQQFTVDFFTNHTLVVLPINCVSNTVDLRQGVEKITFIRHDFDSLIGRTYTPITNIYSLNAITNGQTVKQTFRRIVTQPDILFTAADLVSGPTTFPFVTPLSSRTVFGGTHVDQANAGAGLAGPGTIQPPLVITLDKVGPIYFNFGPAFIDELNGVLSFIWGSFDGSTNEPIVYPSGTSIQNIERQLLITFQLSVINGVVGAPFDSQVTVTGATPPYSFSLAFYSPPLPAGLSLSPSGEITGTPQQAGTFPFVVHFVDADGLMVDKGLSIFIGP